MKFYGASKAGPVRKNNQDAFFLKKLNSDVFVCAVCDGMGGAAAGNLASETASSVIYDGLCTAFTNPPDESFDYYRVLKTVIKKADDVIFDLMDERPELAGMGTTTVLLVEFNGKAYIANIGDSRCYNFKDGVLKKITKDHSYVQMLIDSGAIAPEDAEHHPQKNIITRSLGGTKRAEPDLFSELAEGSFLLCSDGLTNYLSESRIAEIMSAAGTPQKAVNKMISEAIKNGGGDNVTAVIVNNSL